MIIATSNREEALITQACDWRLPSNGFATEEAGAKPKNKCIYLSQFAASSSQATRVTLIFKCYNHSSYRRLTNINVFYLTDLSCDIRDIESGTGTNTTKRGMRDTERDRLLHFFNIKWSVLCDAELSQ